MCEVEWWKNAMCLPYPTPQVDKMTDKTKGQRNKKTIRRKDRKTARHKNRKTQEDEKTRRHKDRKMMKQCLHHSTPMWTRWPTKQKDKRRKDRKTETDTMVKQCKMLTSPTPSGGQDDGENLLYASNTIRRRILLTGVWNIFSKAEDARTEMFMSESKCRLKPRCVL